MKVCFCIAWKLLLIAYYGCEQALDLQSRYAIIRPRIRHSILQSVFSKNMYSPIFLQSVQLWNRTGCICQKDQQKSWETLKVKHCIKTSCNICRLVHNLCCSMRWYLKFFLKKQRDRQLLYIYYLSGMILKAAKLIKCTIYF